MKQPRAGRIVPSGLEILLLVVAMMVLLLAATIPATHARTTVRTAQDTTRKPFTTTASSSDSQPSKPGGGSVQHPPDETKTDGNTGTSVVVHWKLTCEQLCSAGLGGPSCGASWLRPTTTDPTPLPLDNATLDAVCPSLCVNGLGVSKCKCNNHKLRGHSNQDLVCAAFCSAANLQLKGCSRCDGSDAPSSTTAPDPVRNAMEIVQTTTPNWDELCSVFCKMGDGGTLCNCDLPPFF
ncbi:uncharacterized protein LOC126576531 [Anopheles aquasalis]|uniref:uncharacterized protein LOC126576531 n=1 Tax=Anopheles aquasalis TaxID=42839 RepID=UPI00215A6C00|nr:uncharacterized protein LOC126576531 [Anopheles aquasalis]